MKKSLFTLSAAVLALLGWPVLSQAQSGGGFDLSWSKIAGGGGTSTNGQYSLSGTIGQHDAGGPLTNGVYSLTGGFWVLPLAVQTPGAPTLTIAPEAPGQATLSWTPPTPGYTLEVTDSLSPPNWTGAPSTTNNPTTVSANGLAKFYRLRKP